MDLWFCKCSGLFADAGIKAPLFEEDCGGVRVTLFRKIEDVAGVKNHRNNKKLNFFIEGGAFGSAFLHR